LIEQLGASLAINYKDADFADVIEEKLGRKAVNVVLDMVGGDYTDRNLKVMAEDGRLSFIAFLRGSRHEVDLVTHVDDPRDLVHRPVLEELCHSVSLFPLGRWAGRLRAAAALARGRALSVAYMTRAAVRRHVQELLLDRGQDVVVGFSSQVASYLPRGDGPPVVFDLVDVDSEKWAAYGRHKGRLLGAVDRLEARRLRAFEADVARRVAHLVVTTEREARLFRSRVADVPVRVIGNGVRLPEDPPPAGRRAGGLMVFTGTMDYPANVQAVEIGAREVLPRVRAAVPEARFRIVGRAPTRAVRRLSRLPGVEVLGEVADVGVHLAEAAVGLFPLRVARGIQNKVLEAMAAGLPVVAPPAVADCLGPDAAAAVAAAEGPEGLAREAADLLRDPGARERHGLAGRRYVRRHHDWDDVAARWEALLAQAAGRVAGPVGAGGG